MPRPLYIYNLFPRLYPDIDAWTEALEHIVAMGFNSLFLNPLHYPGFSRSLYAVSDYYGFNPEFFPEPAHAEAALRRFLARCRALGLDVFMDLVANHTAIDSPLTRTHRDWYVLENGEPMRPFCWDGGNRVVWGDLAKLDHEHSPDRQGLWNYLRDVCLYHLDLGFTGFRCDAAYQVSDAFWRFLIGSLKAEYPHALLLAETLGCSFEDTCRVSACGFDYIFNSSKWWDIHGSWYLENYDILRHLGPTISFAETHDTERLMAEVGGNEAAFLLRLYFSCFFSKGCMLVSGQEYGFTRRLHVVDTTPADWEDTGRDYHAHIARALAIKAALAPLHEEGPIETMETGNDRVRGFIRVWQGQRVLLLLNTDVANEQPVTVTQLESRLHARDIIDYSPSLRLPGYYPAWQLALQPGEVKVLVSEAAVAPQRERVLVG